MRILFISDTHGFHEQLKVPDNINMIIHGGDFGNTKNSGINANECTLFLCWFDKLDVKYKVLIAGNHDTSVERKLVNPRSFSNIIYLEHESIELENIKIFGSPYTPEFHDWAFNINRAKLDRYWQEIPLDTNILITHTPPKGILDLAYKNNGILEFCGCSALTKKVFKVNPKYHLFGHIHNNEDCNNQGIRIINQTAFINGSCVTDGKFEYGLTSQGIIFNYE